MDNLIKKYEKDYSPWLGRPWKQQRGGGCFTLIYDYMKDTGIQTFSKDYSMFVRLSLIHISEPTRPERISESGMVF